MGFFGKIKEGIQKVGQTIREEAEKIVSYFTGSVEDKEEVYDQDLSELFSKHTQKEVTRKTADMLLDASRGQPRSGGSLGDDSICAFIPYQNTVMAMRNNSELKRKIVSELRDIYYSIRNKLYRMIGDTSPSSMDREGIVPRDTGHLRRSIRWSLSRKYAIVPNNNTAPEEVAMYMWIFAKPKYAHAVTKMDRVKAYKNQGPAVQHPTKFPYLNYSRKTGKLKFDPAADPNFYKMLLAEGKRMAKGLYNRSVLVRQYFYLDLRSDIRT